MSLDLAIRHALKNPITPKGRNSISRFGAVLTNGNSTYLGWNSYKTHPMQFRFSKHHEQVCIHAEISAIAQACRVHYRFYNPFDDFKDYTMYVARVLKDGTPALARPCPACWSALTEFGIRNVIWTT